MQVLSASAEYLRHAVRSSGDASPLHWFSRASLSLAHLLHPATELAVARDWRAE
jgi:hypothetical protein